MSTVSYMDVTCRLHGPGTLTYADGGTVEETIVNGYIDEGMAKNVKYDDGNTYLHG